MKKIFSLFIALTAVFSMSAKTIYLNSGVWAPEEGWFAVYCITGESWATLKAVAAEENVYSAEIADEVTKVVFCRMDKTKSELVWSSVQNQTEDLTIEEGKDLFTIISWGEGWGAKCPGVWSKHGEVVIPPTFYITGDSALVTDGGAPGKAWNPGAIKSEKDTFVLNLKGNQDYLIKLAINGTWSGVNNVKGYNELTEKTAGLKDVSDDHNIGFRLNADGPVKVIYIPAKDENPEVFKLVGDFFVYEPKLANGYYLVGIFGGEAAWGYESLTAAKKFVLNEGTTEAVEYQLENVTLAEGDSLKVVYLVDDKIQWYAPEEKNYFVDASHAGLKTVYFRPNGDGGEDWWYKCIYVPDNGGSTAVDNTEATVKSVKTLENGMLIIEKNGVRYTVMGQAIR